jgi:hypothetical protein
LLYQWPLTFFVMPGLVPGIHDLKRRAVEDVDGRDKPGHDDEESRRQRPFVLPA